MNNLVISDIMSIFASSKRRRPQNLFYVVYICKSVKQEDRGGGCSPPLIIYMEKEKAKEVVLGEGLPIYDGIYFCLYLFSVVTI